MKELSGYCTAPNIEDLLLSSSNGNIRFIKFVCLMFKKNEQQCFIGFKITNQVLRLMQ